MTQPQSSQCPNSKAVVLKPAIPPIEKFRRDYKTPDYLIDEVYIEFDLYDEETKVFSRLTVRRREGAPPGALVLDGEDLDLRAVRVGLPPASTGTPLRAPSGVTLTEGAPEPAGYSLTCEGKLVIPEKALPAAAAEGAPFVVETEVVVNPRNNLQLMGLYKSGALFCTQCEAEGFRRITYFIDRPDILSLYKVRVAASKAENPVLLSNGDCIENGEEEGNADRHFALFVDPHRKPCYLFALVAGKMECVRDTFTTVSGKSVLIQVYGEVESPQKLTWALESVKKSMKWDEDTFGREYDLSVFNVVAVKDFNMGAMENKGLNIFNCSLLLADPKTTTDIEYQHILNVVGHEYFHNWTGNRVTCRDWFQLTLKEGLTVFRDQLFTATMCSAAVKRIEDVQTVKDVQFIEDGGPMAHPIRPESYIAMDNFYTSTVYRKGAEVIRMYYTLLGPEGFRKGMDLYFARHDGQAVTCDDFRAAMADANNKDFTQFERWYLQAGTPEVTVEEARRCKETNTYVLRLKQRTPPTPGQPEKLPLVIPIKFGLIGKQSKKDLLEPPTMVLEMTEEDHTFTLPNITEDCVPSLLRDFSAPVKIIQKEIETDLAFLMAYDSDPINQWGASQKLAAAVIMQRAEIIINNKLSEQDVAERTKVLEPLLEVYLHAVREALMKEGADNALKALTLRLPSFAALAQDMRPIDPEALTLAIDFVRREIYLSLSAELNEVYRQLTLPAGEAEGFEREDVARRRLRNTILGFITANRDKEAAAIAYKHFINAKVMTDKYAALIVLGDMKQQEREAAFEAFYEEAKGDALLVDKWFRAQAFSDLPDQVERVEKLSGHPDFSLKTPNRMRSLFFAFTLNHKHFHRSDGKGYKLLADVVLAADKFNPQIAARAAGVFLPWRKYGEQRQELMQAELRRIAASPGLSPDTREIVQKALKPVES